MRAIFICLIFIINLIYGCASIEVAKEVTKATKSVETSVKKIFSTDKKSEETILTQKKEINEKEREEKILTQKKEMSEEKKQIDEVFNKQKKIASINILNKTYEELGNIFGSPSLIRNDGKTTTVRFDSNKCRLFIFMNLSAETPYAEHYELRNGKGQLIDRDKDIESCFNEIKSA